MAAVIFDARVIAAHEGVAEMVVSLRYENGGTTDVALDHRGVEALMQAAGATCIEDLKGVSWLAVKDALLESFNQTL